ncbi:MAG: MATE family efflux transporter [Planctomycetes bacterium]|nr:MATE family efflux transporter [Planctomycetota bacterium]
MQHDQQRQRLAGPSPGWLVFWLALPVLGEQFLNFCVGFYDTFLSGRIGPAATAAIGLAAYVSWLAGMLFGLVGTGTTALVARHWGAGEFEAANRATNCSIALAVAFSGLVYGVIYTAAPGIAWLLDMDEPTRQIVVRYLRIDGVGHLFTSVSLVGAAALRGAGDMRSPLIILGTVSVLNAAVSTVLVFGVGPWPSLGIETTWLRPLGIDGIVLGTVIARCIGGLLMLGALARGLSGLRLTRDEFTVRSTMAARILRIGTPAALDGLLMWCGHFLFLMVIANLGRGRFDSVPFAAHIVGIQVEAITYLPAVAWGYAAATMVGQSLGAGRPDRAVRAGHAAALQCGLLAVGISLLFYFGADRIYSIMHQAPEVQAVGAPAFRFLAWFQVPLVFSIVYVYALRGAGDTRFPMLVTALGVYGVRLPGAWWCGIVLHGGLLGAWIGMVADVCVRALLVFVRFMKGRWQAIEV